MSCIEYHGATCVVMKKTNKKKHKHALKICNSPLGEV